MINKTGYNNQGWAQELFRPGTAISHVSNLCTAVGRDQNKESFLREMGPRSGIRIYCYCIFHIYQKTICIRSNLIYLL